MCHKSYQSVLLCHTRQKTKKEKGKEVPGSPFLSLFLSALVRAARENGKISNQIQKVERTLELLIHLVVVYHRMNLKS